MSKLSGDQTDVTVKQGNATAMRDEDDEANALDYVASRPETVQAKKRSGMDEL